MYNINLHNNYASTVRYVIKLQLHTSVLYIMCFHCAEISATAFLLDSITVKHLSFRKHFKAHKIWFMF